MPTLKLTSKEAASLAAKRKRDKAYNAVLQAVIEKLKPRTKTQDPIEQSIILAVLQDVRRMMR
jgi:hypothetical protein